MKSRETAPRGSKQDLIEMKGRSSSPSAGEEEKPVTKTVPWLRMYRFLDWKVS
jgi:hypothetical protein